MKVKAAIVLQHMIFGQPGEPYENQLHPSAQCKVEKSFLDEEHNDRLLKRVSGVQLEINYRPLSLRIGLTHYQKYGTVIKEVLNYLIYLDLIKHLWEKHHLM